MSTRIWRPLLRITSALLLICTLGVATAEDAQAASGIRVFQFNMAGSSINLGGYVVAEKTAYSINSRSSNVVTLNEVCYSQYKIVLEDTGLNGHFTETNGPNTGLGEWANRCNDGRFGNAILTPYPLSWLKSEWLPYPSTTERRKVLCGMASLSARDIEICVTHTTSSDYQIERATSFVNYYAVDVGRATIFGGDFNRDAETSSMNRLYAPVFQAGFGHFGEIDQHCGNPVFSARDCGTETRDDGDPEENNKIDYIFSSAGGAFCCREASITTSQYSDHKILSGTQTLQ